MSFRTPDLLKADAEAIWADLETQLAECPLKNKQRLQIPLQDMPAQHPDERRANMQEVTHGYHEVQAWVEAERCLQCPSAPCIAGCPVAIDIPRFIRKISERDYAGSLDVIRETSLLPSICGRVCPQEAQCQLHCTVGKAKKDVFQSVSIGRLERFVADRGAEEQSTTPATKPETGRKVAIIGSGPAAITAAADIRREGHTVTIFEAFHKPGGVLVYGIPEFRLPKRIVEDEITTLEAMGVEIRTNFLVGRTRTLAELREKDGYEAIFIGSGAGLPKFMHIEGENLVGVFAANEYLTRSNLMKAYDRDHSDTPIFRPGKVAVFGGGNVAMDAARTALRLGAEEVNVIYRRTRTEMPARAEEVDHAEKEGVRFHFLRNPARILGNENEQVRAIELLKFELGEPDESGRRRPVEIPGSEYEIPVDTVIVSIGNDSNPLLTSTTPELETNKRGNIVADEDGRTSMEGVWAGGDSVLGAATVILAMGHGCKAAAAINAYLAGERGN
jgi:glutamate synthase (NADPH/NADH) small chain